MPWILKLFKKGEPPAQKNMGPLHLVNFDDRTYALMSRLATLWERSLDLEEGKDKQKIIALAAQLVEGNKQLHDTRVALQQAMQTTQSQTTGEKQ